MSYQNFPPSLLTLSPRLSRAGDPASSIVGLNTIMLADGCWCYCTETRTEYQLDKQDNTTPADGIVVLAPLSGPGRWLQRSSAAASSFIVYAPGIVDAKAPVYNDWNQIESIVNAAQGAVRLGIDMTGLVGFAHIPSTANLDGRGRLEIVGCGPRGEPQMAMDDGAVIKNVREWRTIVVRAAPTIRSPVLYDMNGLDVECFDATFLFPLGGTPTLPIIEIVPGGILLPNGYLGLFLVGSSEFRNTNAPLMPVAHVGANVALLLSIGLLFFGSSFDTTISGELSSSLNVQTDSSLPPNIALPAFAGPISRTQIDQAPGVGYTPAVLADWSGVSPLTVQGALDRIAAKITPIPP